MFAKSKRFQDGPKDYIPGPGEYNPLTADELSKHKRYGFLQQTSRFGPDGIEPSGEFYASTEHSLPSLSSETRLSLSSSSTTKTEDARTRRQMSDMASQFEKYRVAMQKEIDALQLKSRKMESNLQAALSQKESIQSNLLNKEQELAEMRMKNNTLQKTLNRLEKNIEKSPRVIQLQKQLEQVQNELHSSKEAAERSHEEQIAEQSRLVSAITEKDNTISELQSQIDTQSTTITDLNNELETTKSDITRMKKENETAVSQLQAELLAISEKLAAALGKIEEKDDKLQKSESAILELQTAMQTLQNEKATLQEDIQQMNAQHKKQMEVWKNEQKELSDEVQRLQSAVQQHVQQIESTQMQLSEEREQAECLRETAKQQEQEIERKTKMSHKLRNQLSAYRTHMTGVMQEMRSQFVSHCQQKDENLQRVAKELVQAKIFINNQAQYLDGLKSELHWISKWNQQLQDLIQALYDDATMRNPIGCKRDSSLQDSKPVRKESLTDSGFFTGTEVKDT